MKKVMVLLYDVDTDIYDHCLVVYGVNSTIDLTLVRLRGSYGKPGSVIGSVGVIYNQEQAGKRFTVSVWNAGRLVVFWFQKRG